MIYDIYEFMIQVVGSQFHIQFIFTHFIQGDALIVPTCQQFWGTTERSSWEGYNQGISIKYLISAPTMRVPEDVSGTNNAYLAFRAVILAGKCQSNILSPPPP